MKSKKTDILFTTDQVDCSFYMSADLHVKKTFKDALQFEFEGQRNDLNFTLYRKGVKELRDFLNIWLSIEDESNN